MKSKYKFVSVYYNGKEAIIIYFNKDKSVNFYIADLNNVDDNIFDILKNEKKINYIELDNSNNKYGKFILK